MNAKSKSNNKFIANFSRRHGLTTFEEAIRREERKRVLESEEIKAEEALSSFNRMKGELG